MTEQLRRFEARQGRSLRLPPSVDWSQQNRAQHGNDRSFAAPRDAQYLHQIFEIQVARQPEAPAIRCRDQVWTYAEVETQANALAHHLRVKGLRTGQLVALFCSRSQHPLVAILAILKAGGAYVPLDPSHPDERSAGILDDAGIEMVISEQALVGRNFLAGRHCIAVDDPSLQLENYANTRLDPDELGLEDAHLCYVLYTSGSTGRPKGVMTEHRNVVHFVAAFDEVCQMRPSDVVYHGFSLGFDGSVEEMWMAYFGGACLVVGTDDIAKLGPEVADLIDHHGVTFFSTVPTFLSLVPRDLPSLRLLIVSGEACPAETVNRWARPGRKMLNVYGPTETTVNTTSAELRPDQPVTIGRPLRGYDIHILDEDLQPVPEGSPGELYIGGPGLARGYLNHPELSARHFVANPTLKREVELGRVDQPHQPSKIIAGTRLYRTGDRVQWNAEGELLFLGRLDSQVKIRGYRVELAEIESVLLEQTEIQAAVVHVHRDKGGLQQLVAYVIATEDGPGIDERTLHAELCRRLPAYMVPAFLEQLEVMPMLASGKADRKRLPPPQHAFRGAESAYVAPECQLERDLTSAFAELFNLPRVSVEADFFQELGGHSLLAAKLVSQLRTRYGHEIAVRDLYQHPHVRGLAKLLASRESVTPTAAPNEERPRPSLSRGRHLMFGLGQSLAVLWVYGLAALPASLALWLAFLVLDGGLGAATAVALVIVGAGLSVVLRPLLAAAGKWLIIGRYRAGHYRLWGTYHLRFWMASRLQSLSGASLFVGTPLMPLYFRLMGAKIGRGVMLDTGLCTCFDLVELGDDTSIGSETQLLGYRVEGGWLKLGRIKVGRDCFVGVHANLGLDVEMGNGARLADLSYLPDQERLAAGAHAKGSPARTGDMPLPTLPEVTDDQRPSAGLWIVLHLLASFVSGLWLLPWSLPSLAIVWLAWLTDDALIMALSLLPASAIAVVGFCLGVASFKRLVLPRTKTGAHRLNSWFYLRKWTVDGLVRASTSVIRPVYTTMFLPTWLRMLGAKIGARAEIATVSQISPDLMTIEDESFFADGSIIGGRRFHRGHVILERSHVGRRSFVGNSGMLPQGTGLGDNCLLGCLSTPPQAQGNTEEGSEWLGSPAFALPRREVVGGFSEAETYRPGPRLYCIRFILDSLRILLPAYIGWASFGLFAIGLWFVYHTFGSLHMWLVAPAMAAGAAQAAAFCVVICKWLLMGRFRPVHKPLWSVYVWLNEVVNGSYESVFAPALAPLLGTPFIAPWLRAMGCRIGRRCHIETNLFSEFDLVHVGDEVALNPGVIVQNHLFEDRIMKSSDLTIGDRASIGNMSVVLYDSEIKADGRLGPLSLLMKGEVMAAADHRHGIPTCSIR